MVDTRRAANPDDSGGFDVELIRSPEGIARVRSEWIEFLEKHAGVHNAFHHPDIVQQDLQENAEIFTPCIVVLRHEGGIAGIAAWYVHKLRFPLKVGVINAFRVPFRLLKLYGGSIVLHHESDEHAVTRAALEAAAAWKKEYDVVALFDIPVPGGLSDFAKEHASGMMGRVIPATPEPVVKRLLELPETLDVFMASLTSKKRNSLRRYERRLRERSNNTLVFDRITDPSDVPSYLMEVEQVYRKSWQGRTMGGQRSSEAQIRFLQKVAEHGWFRSYIVRCAGQPICFGLGYQYDGIYYGEDMGYDIDWRECAPGNYMVTQLIADLYQTNTPRIMEFGTGDNLFKQEYSNTAEQAQTFYLTPKGSVYGASVIRTQRLLDRVYHFGHRTVSRLGIDRWVRERIKRKR